MDRILMEFSVDAQDFVSWGQASDRVKKTLKQMGVSADIVRKAAIAMYEGEINMAIHAGGGKAVVEIYPDRVDITLRDQGPGIPDIDKALSEGFSTATEEIRELGFGAGMGLPNMRHYSDDFRIESVVGKGTTVYMSVVLSC